MRYSLPMCSAGASTQIVDVNEMLSHPSLLSMERQRASSPEPPLYAFPDDDGESRPDPISLANRFNYDAANREGKPRTEAHPPTPPSDFWQSERMPGKKERNP